MHAQPSILSIQHVTKRYDQHVAVRDMNLEVPKGSLFGMLGPNGAGKTSLIRMITTITAPDEGTILLDGKPLDRLAPDQIGYMPEERGLYKKMKVGEHLLYLARLKGMSAGSAKEAIDYWFEKFDIHTWANKKVEDLSKGMQQKVQFVATVVHRPKLLILDEPFSGLDPINSNLIIEEIRQLNAQGTSIIFSTHRMEQVEELCQFIVLINKGQNVLQGEVKSIKNDFKENKYFVEVDGTLPADFFQKFQVFDSKTNSATVGLSAPDQSNQLLSYLIDQNLRVVSFEEILPTFNEIFIRRVQETQS